MVNLDVSVFIQIVNFVFLVWALNAVLYRPIRAILRQRKEKLSGLEQKIQSSQVGAREKDDALAAGIKAARARGLEEKKSMLQAAGEEEKRILAEINAKAQAEMATLREKIARDTDGVRQALQRELDGFAKAIGQKILGREV